MRFELIGPTIADHLAPGGKWADLGEMLRFCDAELSRLRASGASLASMSRLIAAQQDLLACVSMLDATEQHIWLVTPEDSDR